MFAFSFAAAGSNHLRRAEGVKSARGLTSKPAFSKGTCCRLTVLADGTRGLEAYIMRKSGETGFR